MGNLYCKPYLAVFKPGLAHLVEHLTVVVSPNLFGIVGIKG